MGLDIYFSEDIRNALLAANEASASTAAVIAEVGTTDLADPIVVNMRAYREGYKAALIIIALAFGISPQALSLRPFDNEDRTADDTTSFNTNRPTATRNRQAGAG